MADVRRLIERQIHGLVGFGAGTIDLDHGDAGLLGPRSVAWTVHGDFTSMMVGGIGALLLQMLHPGALAGVWDHSNFRDDMAGRLRRTAQFVAGTTYGSTEVATRLIDRVRAIHDRVTGTLPDGTPYAANDPALLTWVHVTEVASFLAGYLRYRGSLPIAAQDRYLVETALIAERLGACDVPKSRMALDAYLDAMRPALRYDERTRTVAAILLAQPAPHAVAAPFREIVMQAGIELLPDWARRMHGIAMGPARRRAIRIGVRGAARIARWAVRDGSAARARRRAATIGCGNPPEPVGLA